MKMADNTQLVVLPMKISFLIVSLVDVLLTKYEKSKQVGNAHIDQLREVIENELGVPRRNLPIRC